MKGAKYSGVAKLTLIITAILVAGPMFAQAPDFSQANGDYYRVHYQGPESRSQDLARQLDACAELFEEYLHFERSGLKVKLRVRIFPTQENYKKYLKDIIGEPKDSFVYLQYSDPAMNELVGYETGAGFENSLVHHAFIQYLKSFITHPPLWLQKGMAIYLENSRYNPERGRAEYHENLAWLKSLKTYIALDTEVIPVSILLTMDVAAANRRIESFYAQSWGLVHFLLNSENKDYNRILWDTLSFLKSDASRQENETLVLDKGFGWVNKDLFLSDFEEYINTVKTFPDLVQEGIIAYNRGDFDAAEELFNRSLELKKDHYIPYYYLGLIQYARQDYTVSDNYYQRALERGGSRGLIYYARGITAYSARNDEEAKDFLSSAVEADPEGYGVKARELLSRLETEEPETAAPEEDAADQDPAESEDPSEEISEPAPDAGA
ncbi:tetratricopeptide repeat protein [Marispirochaeta sp.]|uniref:tetratricopeptide repeat protein n=1 Tax=Marispirochaeta sp. TaxID=2038653 RepID=UPI0029C74E6B|nr:tetratricopeptide repeat protein [Marispirochaeta sp.]